VSKPVVLKIFRNGGVVDIKQFVDQPQIVIGSADADVQVKLQGQVSLFHASIEKRNDKYVLSDLGSSQGTYLKGAKVLEAVLEHGDKIAVGEYIIEFYVGAPGVAVVAPTQAIPAPVPIAPVKAPPPVIDDEDTLVDAPVPRPLSQVSSKVVPVAAAGGGVIAAAVPSNAKRKKGEKTFAPASTYKNLNEFVRPTKGSTVEVLVAWKERVIDSYHFHQKGTVTYGSHPSADIVIPSLTAKIHKASLLQIDGKVTVFIPPGMAGSLVVDNQTTALTQLYSQGRLQAAPGGGSTITLAQGEMVRVGLGGDVELVVRYCSETPKPMFIPMIDFASNGFLAVLLAVILAIVVSLYTALNKVEDKIDDEDEYRTALIIENPPPLPPPVKIEKMETPPPVEKEVPKPPPPEKKIVKVEPKKEPVPQKMEVKKQPTRTPVKQEPKRPSAKAANGGDGKTAKSMKANPNKPKSNQPGSVKQGGSVKNAAKDGAQAESTTKDPSKSGIFGVFGTGGKQAKLDNTYSGSGELAGMADNATGKAGFGEDRAGEGLGSKLKETGGGSGKSNVGVQGMGNGTGKGLGSGGFTGVGLGGKGTVSIVPGGGGETYGGNIDRNGIRQVFINNQRALASCYERALSTDKGLGGKIMLDFDIGEQGRVSRAEVSQDKSTLVNASLANCVISKMKTWRFPEPPNKNETVQVFYPLAFSNN
jgi:pSer/pThr/pTyr-binding forkhead associated (FHA) protein/outer membrane biosynthesis protein TonB